MTPILSHKQAEEMLPDYAFGRLQTEDAVLFEESIIAYPDLEQELIEIKSVFSKVEKMDFNSILEHRTRNISVRVQEKLNAPKSHSDKMSTVFRIVIPTVGLAAMALFFFINENSPFNTHSNNSEYTNNQPIQVVSSSDVASIFSDEITANALLAESRLHQNNSMVTIPTLVTSTIDEIIADNIFIPSDESTSENPLQKELLLDNLTDSEIQTILNELNYENPSTL